MHNILDIFDIQQVIVSFLGNKKELLTWKHICSKTMYVFDSNFLCNSFNDFFNVTRIKTSDLALLLEHRHKIIELHCEYDLNITDMSIFYNLKILKCYQNKKINKLPHSLEELFCGWNNCLSDDIISNALKLKLLQCDFNVVLTSKSIGNLINLTYLDLGANYKCNDEMFKNLPKLQYLNCGINIFTDTALSYLPNLLCLKCGYKCKFTDDGLKYVQKLQILICGKCPFTDDGIKFLTKLVYLDCDYNNLITDKILQYTNKLQYLDCNKNINFTTEKLLNSNLVHNIQSDNFNKNILLKFNSLSSKTYIVYNKSS